MAGLDYNEQYANTESKIKSLDTFNQALDSEKQITSQQQSSLEMDDVQTATP
jgi:hypothetical protein